MIEIKCIEIQGTYIENPHQAIVSFGYTDHDSEHDGKMTLALMIQHLTTGHQAYITTALGEKAMLVTHTAPSGKLFVISYLDGKFTDDLLKLPRCK